MKLDFVRNTKRNMLAGVVASVAGMVLQFVNRTLFLWLLGPEYLGLNGLFSSVLGVLSLAELGFSTALVCAMYKPIAEDDRELLCAYLKFFRDVYRGVGTAIFVLGLCLLPFVPRLVHGSVPEGLDLRVLYLIHLVNTSASYFLFAYRGSVLHAYHRGDLLVNMNTALRFAQYFTVLAVLLLTRNYYHYVLVAVAFTVLNNLAVLRMVRRHFPEITPHGRLAAWRRKALLNDIKAIFLHRVGGMISSSVDNLVISAFLGLVAVAAYGNYYYVMTVVAGLVSVGYGSVVAGLGNKIHTVSKEENFRLFMKMVRLTMMAVTGCGAVMMALYQPFLREWTKNNPDLVRHALTPVLMVAYFHVWQARQALLSFKGAAGLWHADRWKPIVAGAANLVLTVVLVVELPGDYKLDGVAFATLATYALIQMPWETHVVFTQFFGRHEERRYWRMQGAFALLAAVLCAAAWGVARAIPLEGIPGLAAKGAAASAVAGGPLAVLFRKDLAEALRRFRG